jgi:tRNA(adenine34) deaminase
VPSSNDEGEEREGEAEGEGKGEDERFMREALVEAAKAASKGEVPVGAVLVLHGVIIARAHNL